MYRITIIGNANALETLCSSSYGKGRGGDCMQREEKSSFKLNVQYKIGGKAESRLLLSSYF